MPAKSKKSVVVKVKRPEFLQKRFDETWESQKATYTKLFCNVEAGVKADEHMLRVTELFNYCAMSYTPEIIAYGESLHDQNTRFNSSSMFQQDIYEATDAFLVEYCKQLYEKLDAMNSDEKMMTLLGKQWDRYTISAKTLDAMCGYLNRYYVKRKIDENKYVRPIYAMAMDKWKQVILDPLLTRIVSCLLRYLHAYRDGTVVRASLVSNIVNCVITTSSLASYRTGIEDRIIQETEVYYEKESVLYLDSHSISEYLKKVEQRFESENELCDSMLYSSSKSIIINVLKKTLIVNHMSALIRSFDMFLDNFQVDDLKRLHSLITLTGGHLQPILDAFQAYVHKEGYDSINDIVSDNEDVDPQQYIQTIYCVHHKFENLTNDALHKDNRFMTALDKAFKKLVNANKVTEKYKSVKKSPELLAKYADSLLRTNSSSNSSSIESTEAGATGEGGSTDALLKSVMVVFKYIEDKDVFQEFYQKHLSKRLIDATSASEDNESAMITSLQSVCGNEYTSNLQKMFLDINSSKTLTSNFKSAYDVSKDSGADSLSKMCKDFHIQILSTNNWPRFNPDAASKTYTPVNQIASALESFEQFYSNQYKGRKLNWCYGKCTGDLIIKYAKSRLAITCNFFQISILTLYNEETTYTLKEIQDATKIDLPKLISNLKILAHKKHRILVSKNVDKEGDTYKNDTVFTLNEQVSFGKKRKINLARRVNSSSKSTSKDKEGQSNNKDRTEDERILAQVAKNRSMSTQAAIVRIMKMRKQLPHSDLIIETIKQLHKTFEPSVSIIKKSISNLIDKGYIKRKKDQRDWYEYMA